MAALLMVKSPSKEHYYRERDACVYGLPSITGVLLVVMEEQS